MKTMKACMASFCCILGVAVAGMVSAQQAVRVVNEGGIREEWMLAPGISLPAPGYPGEFAARGDNVCVAMGYRIHPDGSTGEFSLLRVWSSSGGEQEPEAGFWDAYSRASVAALQQWKFAPRPGVATPRAVDTVATMTFMGKQAEDPAGLRARCRIDDLVAFLEDAKLKLARRSDMNRHQIEKNMRETMGNLAKDIQSRRAGKEQR